MFCIPAFFASLTVVLKPKEWELLAQSLGFVYPKLELHAKLWFIIKVIFHSGDWEIGLETIPFFVFFFVFLFMMMG